MLVRRMGNVERGKFGKCHSRQYGTICILGFYNFIHNLFDNGGVHDVVDCRHTGAVFI